jgi:hypothetical protein
VVVVIVTPINQSISQSSIDRAIDRIQRNQQSIKLITSIRHVSSRVRYRGVFRLVETDCAQVSTAL